MAYSTQSSVVIKASPEKVWAAITEPDQVKQYFFGTNLVTNWDVGSPIFFLGEWQGKSYEDKGTVLDFHPLTTLSYNYWSSMGDLPDEPNNYMVLRYDLEPVPEGTKLTISQSNISTQEKADHSAKNWQGVLESLKKFVESC